MPDVTERPLFGELLGRFVPLSGHDVCEILSEQGGSGRRFGQIALAWGLCRPADVWEAWHLQLAGRTPRVDLATFGIDAQSTAHLPGAIAAALGVVPVRLLQGGLVVAASESTLARAAEALPLRVGKPVTFVLSDPFQIEQAIRTYYPTAAADRMPRGACAARPCAQRCIGSACKRRSMSIEPVARVRSAC